MTQYNTSLKLLYESQNTSSIAMLAKALGVTESVLNKAHDLVINGLSTNIKFDEYLNRLQIALQNVMATDRDDDGIKIEDIAEHANLFLRRYKNQISNTLVKVYEEQIGYYFNKTSELSKELSQIVDKFNPYIKKLDTNSELGDITENFITVNNMKLLYESDDANLNNQKIFYSLDLKTMFIDLEKKSKSLSFKSIQMKDSILNDIVESHNKGKKEFEDALKNHLRITSLPKYNYDEFTGIKDIVDFVDEFVQERVKETISLAYVTSIISNQQYFNESGIKLETGGIENHVDLVDTTFTVKGDDLPWADILVKRYGNDTARLNKVYNDFITDSLLKYMMINNDKIYTSVQKEYKAQYDLEKQKLQSEQNSLNAEFDLEIKSLEKKATLKLEQATRRANRKKASRERKLNHLKIRNSDANEETQKILDNMSKFYTSFGAVAGGVGGTYFASGMITSAFAATSVKAFIATLAFTPFGMAAAIGGAALVGAKVGKGFSGFKASKESVRKSLGLSSKSYGESGIDPKTGNVNLDDLDPSKSLLRDTLWGPENVTPDKYSSFDERQKMEGEYLKIQDAIEEEYENALEEAENEFMNVTSDEIKAQGLEKINRANEIDIKLKELDLQFANEFEHIKQRMLSSASFQSLRSAVSAVILNATKLAKNAINTESITSIVDNLLLEADTQQLGPEFIEQGLTSLGVDNVSNDLNEVVAYITKSIFDIDIPGIKKINLDAQALEAKSLQEKENIKSKEEERIPPGQPANNSITEPEFLPQITDNVNPETIIPLVNFSGSDNLQTFLKELATNQDLQSVIEQVILGEKMTYQELVSEISEVSDSLSGFEKAIVQGLDAFKQSLPPIPLELAKQIIKDKIKPSDSKIIEFNPDSKPENLKYKKVYEEQDFKPRIVLLSQFFKIDKSANKINDNVREFIRPKLSDFVNSIMYIDDEDNNELSYEIVDQFANLIIRNYDASEVLEENSSFNIARRNLSLIAERRLKMERDIHNVLYKAWKI